MLNEKNLQILNCSIDLSFSGNLYLNVCVLYIRSIFCYSPRAFLVSWLLVDFLPYSLIWTQSSWELTRRFRSKTLYWQWRRRINKYDKTSYWNHYWNRFKNESRQTSRNCSADQQQSNQNKKDASALKKLETNLTSTKQLEQDYETKQRDTMPVTFRPEERPQQQQSMTTTIHILYISCLTLTVYLL